MIVHSITRKTSLCLPEILRERAAHQQDQTAYSFLFEDPSRTVDLSYRELGQRVRNLSALLGEVTKRGDFVLLLYPSSGPDFYVAFLACLDRGLVAIPAYPPHMRRDANHGSVQRILAIIEDSRPALCLGPGQIVERMKHFSVEQPRLKTLEWLATDADFEPGSEADREPVREDEPALIQYTSGSTSTPRGVMIGHGNLIANQRQIRAAFGHDERTVFASWLPFFHDMGLIGNFMQPLYLGIPAVMMPPTVFLRQPVRWLQAISDYRATTSGAPNFAYDLCARRVTEEQKSRLDLSSWKVAYNGAEPVQAETLRRFARAFAVCGLNPRALFPVYGLAEATLLVAAGRPGGDPITRRFARQGLEEGIARSLADDTEEPAVELVSVGQEVQDSKLIIVDPHTGIPRGTHQIGEIWISGPAVAEGYFGHDDNPATFRARPRDVNGPEDTYLRTGDLGFRDEAGELFITGRLKDLMILNGRNHAPEDLEQLVNRGEIPEFIAGGAAVFSVPGDDGENPVLLQEVGRHLKSATEDLMLRVRDLIARETGLALACVVLVRQGSLPRTSSGKIQRSRCRALFLNDELPKIAEWSIPVTGNETSGASDFGSLERHVRNRLAVVLGRDPESIQLNLPFAALGIDSVKATTLLAELEVRLGRTLPSTLPFEYETPARLLAYLNKSEVIHEDTGFHNSRRKEARSAPTLSAPSREILEELRNFSGAEVDSLFFPSEVKNMTRDEREQTQ